MADVSIWHGVGAPTHRRWQKDDIAIDNTGAMFRCTRGGEPGTWEALTPAGGGDSGASGPSKIVDFLFTEEATAGVLTATFDAPAGAVVVDVLGYIIAGFSSDTAVFDMADPAATAGNGYADAMNLKGLGRGGSADLTLPYSPVDDYANGCFTLAEMGGNWHSISERSVDAGGEMGVYYATARTVTMTITTTIATPPISPTGVLLLRIEYVEATTPTAATFA